MSKPATTWNPGVDSASDSENLVDESDVEIVDESGVNIIGGTEITDKPATVWSEE